MDLGQYSPLASNIAPNSSVLYLLLQEILMSSLYGMATDENAEADATLELIFRNGNVGVGLNPATPTELATDDRIRIPESMRSATYARLEPGEVFSPISNWDNPGGDWVRVEWVTICNRRFFTFLGDDGIRTELFDVTSRPPTAALIRDFIFVNCNHIRQGDLDPADINWVHATRFWAVASGFACSRKSTKFVVVPAPRSVQAAGVPDADVNFVVNFTSRAWAACAARAASWRQTNTTTGGDIATGLPREWLENESLWASFEGSDEASVDKRSLIWLIREQATLAFFVATNSADVHPILALMAPQDSHSACVDTSFGIITTCSVEPRIVARMTDMIQATDPAMVTEAIYVLQTLASEGVAPYLRARHDIPALLTAYKTIKEGGTGCPDGVEPLAPKQAPVTCSALVGELGAAGSLYLRSKSQILERAAAHFADGRALKWWKDLGKTRAAPSTNVNPESLMAGWGEEESQEFQKKAEYLIAMVRQGPLPHKISDEIEAAARDHPELEAMIRYL
ncbi:Fc.00g034770.m01.CDS01 [Cosmosporella sp. VM-42]